MGCSWDKAVVNIDEKATGSSQNRKCNEPRLTDNQMTIIKNTWQLLKLEIANVGVQTFVRLFETEPELIDTFNQFRGQNLAEIHDNGLLKSHALRVMATIDKCIVNIDEREVFANFMQDIGRVHRKHHVSPGSIRVILPHFLDAVKPHLEERWDLELAEAWEALFHVMIHYLGTDQCEVT